jgi:REP element-mobilizing transposase RayT
LITIVRILVIRLLDATMPCYLFTYHTYRSWMPDRKDGFVRRRQGVLPPDGPLAHWYRKNSKEEPVTFDSRLQRVVIDEFQNACNHQKCRGHFMATDPTHLHVLVSWRDDRPWLKLRNGIKASLTRRLNREKRRQWFAENASRKRVRDQVHYDHLVGHYLPSHRGWKWREGADPFR